MNCAMRACINDNISSSLQLVPASVYVVRYMICHLDPNVNQAYRPTPNLGIICLDLGVASLLASGLQCGSMDSSGHSYIS